MNSEWKEVQLQDVVTKLGDGLHGTPKYTENGEYYFVNGNNLDNGKIVYSDKTKRTSEDEYQKYKKELNERTIFVSINGTLGNVALYNDEKIVLGKSACYFNVKDDIDKMFIKYVVTNKYFQDYIENLATGTTIKNVSLKTMREFPFKLPPLTEQKRIAEILSSLDDKIELNNKMNKNLEEMAQAIFKQWFVDFEFPDENGNPYKSSGGKMIQSELGEIPEGWSVKELCKICEKISKGSTPTQNDIATALDESVIEFIKVKDINENGEISSNLELIPNSVHKSKLKRSILNLNDIIISIAGTIGRVSYIDEKLVDSNINQAVAFLRLFDHERYFMLVYYYLRNNDTQNTLLSKVVQGVQANISLTIINELKIIMPADCMLLAYNKILKSIFENIASKRIQTQSLTKTRDELLPKLMSGELRV